MSSSNAISQKEYLKKYLSGDVKKKKKKKTSGTSVKRLVIVDDDLDLKSMRPLADDEIELYQMDEDAPQIAGIIDERPADVKAQEYYNSKRWKVFGGEDGVNVIDNHNDINNTRPSTDQNSMHIIRESDKLSSLGKGKANAQKYDTSGSQNGKGKSKGDSRDADIPPPRKNDHKNQRDSDESPPRKDSRKELKQQPRDKSLRDQPKFSRNSDSDNSPPRKGRGNSAKEPRKRQSRSSDSDNSPPRKGRKSAKDFSKRISRSRSPPERPRKSGRSGSPKHFRKHLPGKSDKRNPFDKTNNESDSDLSPPRQSTQNDRPRKKTLYKPNDSSSDEGGSKSKNKMKKTLDGKQAGLQDAKQLKRELSDLKMKEDSMFAKMDKSVSGVGAAPVRRDRKTGQIRDLEKEKEAQKEKDAKESVVNEKYYKWGKGIKQTEDASVRAAEAMREMNKPLARYANDTDLDEYLKAQERDGDPMLEFIKQKQSESTPLQGVKPIYKGSYNPNRFNIRPGYRWDGKVRSNGYEQEWFKMKNAKKARDEEAYKWSTSDM